MGHTRLGDLPRTRKWQQVVDLTAGGASAAQLSNATITAAETGMKFAAKDKAMVEAVWLLTQLPLAAKGKDFAGALRAAGLSVSDSPGLMEIVGAVSDAIDNRLSNNRGRTDLGEIAQMAASETIAKFVGSRTGAGLFGTSAGDVQGAFASLGTVKQFSSFAKHFFARMTDRCMNYYLSRAMYYHLGEGGRFATLAQHAEFKKALELHCHQAAVIVERFSGEWFSKTNWEKKGISRQDAAGFTHVAMGKLISELKAGAGGAPMPTACTVEVGRITAPLSVNGGVSRTWGRTWNSPWSTPGGDFAAIGSATLSPGTPAAIPAGPAIQAMIDGGPSLQNILIRKTAPDNMATVNVWASVDVEFDLTYQ